MSHQTQIMATTMPTIIRHKMQIKMQQVELNGCRLNQYHKLQLKLKIGHRIMSSHLMDQVGQTVRIIQISSEQGKIGVIFAGQINMI